MDHQGMVLLFQEPRLISQQPILIKVQASYGHSAGKSELKLPSQKLTV